MPNVRATMTFDDWCAAHGDYLNDSDDAARAAKLMARRAWDAAVAAERERWKEPTNEQVADACLWSRHDFGLLPDEEKRIAMSVIREHWRAVWKACNTPGRGAEYMPPN